MTKLFLAAYVLAQAAAPSTAFDKWMMSDSPQCVQMSEFSDTSKFAIAPLSIRQFEFARGLYSAIPPISKALPAGDHAVLVEATDRSIMVALVDGRQTCARFVAPPFILEMLKAVGDGKTGESGEPL